MVWDRRFAPALRRPLPTLAIGAADQIALVGYADKAVDFGGGPLSAQRTDDNVSACSRAFCAAIVRFDASGAFHDNLVFETPTGQSHAAYDARGSYILTGGGFGIWTDVSANGALWIAKVDADLHRTWVTVASNGSFRGSDPNDYNVSLLGPGLKDWPWNRTPVTDPGGNVMTLSDLLVSDRPSQPPVTGWLTEPDAWWVNKLSPSGMPLWPSIAVGSGGERGKLWTGGRPGAIAVDGQGQTLIAGDFQNEITLGYKLTSNGQRDVFVLKLDPNGRPVWATRVGGDAGDWIGGVAADNDANVWVAGFSGTLKQWDGLVGEPLPPVDGVRNALFVTKLGR